MSAGIAGAMGMEAGADPESDVSQSLSTTERKQYELRAVLQRCVSTGAVTAKKDCAAAICGRMDLGLIDGAARPTAAQRARSRVSRRRRWHLQRGD